jgi:hypothetical protein
LLTTEHPATYGAQRKGWARVDLAARGDVFVPENILQIIVLDEQLGEFYRPFDLRFAVGVPGRDRATIAMRGEGDFVFWINLAEPGLVLLTDFLEQAGIIHFDADGVGIEAHQPGPLADTGMPGDDVEGCQLDDLSLTPEHHMCRRVAAWFACAERLHRTFNRAPGRVMEDQVTGGHDAAMVGCAAMTDQLADQLVVFDSQSHVLSSLCLNKIEHGASTTRHRRHFCLPDCLPVRQC